VDKPLFITFEGMDGSGKTTQMHRLAARLRALGRTVLETAEPGGPPIAMKIRRILLDAANQELSPTTEVLLYFASRAQNVDEWICPRWTAAKSCSPTASRIPRWSIRAAAATSAPNRRALERIACRGLKPISRCWWMSTRKPAWRAPAPATPPRRTAKPAWTTNPSNSTARLAGLPRAGRARAGARQMVDGRADLDAIERAVWEIVSAYV
jgi:hypothetical protein